MADEFSDILGADTLPIGPKKAGSWSNLSFTVKSVVVVASVLVGYVIFVRLWEAFWKWREREYKLSMRRKYGIPDSDHRPFNVAYAAAKLAREEDEEETKQRTRKRRAVQSPAAVTSAHEQALGSARGPQATHLSARSTFPGAMSMESMDSFPSSSSYLNIQDDHYASPLDVHAELPTSSTRRGRDRKGLGILKSSNGSYDESRNQKRAYDLGEDPIDSKKTRVEGEEFIDGDEDPEWERDIYGRVRPRGFKRTYDEDDVRSGDKRQRKVSTQSMDVDEDELGDLVAISPSRGRKRDRAEAGSTFGGDDEENVEPEEDTGHQNSRKRRNKRTSTANAGRSRKRERDLEDYDEINEGYVDVESRRGSKKKRGKNSQQGEDERASDVSMDDSQAVKSTIKGRKIGDEWTNNGVNYKIGPNGERLRETLLKKAKQRFLMPEDSVHPDRSASHDVYVEAWITDEAYQNYAAQGVIYEPPKELERPSSVTSTPPTPSKGKHLLWESTTFHSSIAPPANPFETSRQPSDSLAVAIAKTPSFQRNSRISSAFRSSTSADSSAPPSPGLVDSTNSLASPRYRQYSKWEKQDLEAKAMMRMREANKGKQEEEERLQREKEAKAKALAPPPTIPTILLSKPDEPAKDAPAAKPSLFSIGGPSSSAAPSTSSTTPAPPAPLSFPAFASKTTPATESKASAPSSFSLTPTSNGSKAPTQPGFIPPSANSASTATPSTPGGFSFGPPAAGAKPQEAGKTLGLGFPTPPSAPSTQPPANPFTTSTSAPALPTLNTSSAPTSTPKFSFGPPKPFTETKESASSSSTNPLLARLTPEAPKDKPQPTPLQAQGTTTSAPVFSFAKPTPSSSSPAPVSAFSVSQKPAEATTSHSTPAPASSGSGLKFSFNNPTPSTASSATEFKPDVTQASNPFGKPLEATSTPKFSFGSGPGTNPTPALAFGATSSGTTTTTTPPSATASNPSPFGAPSPSPFASTASTQPKPPSMFGATNTNPSPFSSTASANPKPTSVFGATGGHTTTSAAASSSSPFGAPSPSPFGSSSSANAKPSSGFGATTSTATTSNPSPFGSSSASPFGGTFGATSSSIGEQSTQPSAFGRGGSTIGSSQPTSGFGNQPGPGNNGSLFGTQPSAAGDSSAQDKDKSAPTTSGFGTSGFTGFGAKPKEGGEPVKSAFGTFVPSGTGTGNATSSPFGAFSASATHGGSNAFGTKPSTPGSTGSAATDAGRTATFSFNAGTTTATPAGTPNKFSFGNGSTNTSTPAPAPGGAFSFGGLSTTPAASPFGEKNTFSFGK